MYTAAFLFLLYQQGEKGVEALPLGEQIYSLLQEAKRTIAGGRRGAYSQAEREIPDFDEPPMDPPRKSQYGTV